MDDVVKLDELVERHPVLFHMAEDGTWPSIQQRGLLSTAALVDLYNPPAAVRDGVLNEIRRHSITLDDSALGPAVVRDQAPLKFLDRCLLPGASVQGFLDALNGRVFFWVSEARLKRLLGARLYKNRTHIVLHVDTASLAAEHGKSISLAPYNTGSVHVPGLPARGPETFLPVADYPYGEWARRRGKQGEALVELTVPWSVPDISRHVLEVERRTGDEVVDVLFST
jgi:hypothetical protein